MLQVTTQRISQLIRGGRLPAIKRGGMWLLKPHDVTRLVERQGRGYPKDQPRRAPSAARLAANAAQGAKMRAAHAARQGRPWKQPSLQEVSA